MTINLPRLHKCQFEVIQHPARFKVIAAGRRFGKGFLGIGECFRRAIKGGKCRWVAPSYASDSFQSGWNLAVAMAAQIPGAVVQLQRRQIDFSALGGGWLQFRTAEEPDSLRGEGIDFVIFDEAAHITGLEMLWEQCVRPSLMDRKGAAWFISTPKGFNYFNTLYVKCKSDTAWASFHFSSCDNPTLDPAEIAALRKDMPALVARQEIDAEFVQLAGALFKRENLPIIECAPEGLVWVRPWDLAFTTKTTSDYTASGRVAMDGEGTVYVADIINERREWPEVVKLVAATALLDGQGVRQGIECVSAQVGMLQTLLRDQSLVNLALEPITVTVDKLTRSLPCVSRSEQGKLKIIRCANATAFIDQLCSFPEGEHDDMVDFLSAAFMMLAGTGTLTESDIANMRVGSASGGLGGDDYIRSDDILRI